MKASFYLIAGLVAASTLAAEPRYTIEMTPYHGPVSFYNPAGEIFSGWLGQHPMNDAIIWNGQTTRPAELHHANAKGDGFVNLQVGFDLTLGNEHPIYRGEVQINGVKTRIEPFGGESTWVHSLNADSHFVGTADSRFDGRQPFIFKDGGVQPLNDLIVGAVRFDTPQLIRDDGVIFGTRYMNGGSHAVVRLTPRPDNKYDAVELTILPGAVAFSQNGGVIFQGGYWHDGQITPLGDLGVPDRVYPKAINSSGQIIGIAMTPGDENYHGFLWDGQIHDLKDLVQLPAGWLPSPIAEDINEYGQIAAVAYTGSTHMLLRLTPPPKLIATTATPENITLRFRPGNAQTVSIECSTDLKEWQEIKTISNPTPEQTTQFTAPHPGSNCFFRITRP